MNLPTELQIFDVSTGVFLGEVNPATGRTLFDELYSAMRASNLAGDVRFLNMLEQGENPDTSEVCPIYNRHERAASHGRFKLASDYIVARSNAYRQFMGREPTQDELNVDARALGIYF